MDLGALALLAANIHFELIAVEKAEALVDVGDADAAAVHVGEALGRDADAVVGDFDEEAAVAAIGADVDFAPFEAGGEAVLNGVFDHGLKEHGRDERVESLIVDFLEDLEFVAAEADDFDIEIVVDEFELFAKRDEGFVLAEKAAKDIGELEDDATGHIGIEADQRGDSVKGVEKEMRINLAGEGVHASFEEELLILLEIHLGAGVVPDFDHGGDTHGGGEEDEEQIADVRGMLGEEPAGRKRTGELDAAEFAGGAGEKGEHGPVAAAVAEDVPEPAGKVEEEERAELPDVFFFGEDIANHAGEETDQGGHGAGKPFVIAEGDERDEGAAEEADDASADEAHEEGAFEGEIEEAVADEAQEDAHGERRREEKEELDFLVGVADFGEEEATEGRETNEQGGERGSKADLEKQGEEEVFAGRECAHGGLIR